MPEGKIRHTTHVTDKRAVLFVQSALPAEWVTREMNPDYGIDLYIELFGYEDNKCITLGEHVFVQVKGTDYATYGQVALFGPLNEKYKDQTEKIDILKFSVDVTLLNLVERMGSSIPVLLVVVDLSENCAYYVCLNDYIRFVLPYQNCEYKKQKTVVIYIPKENILSKEALLWYGKRPKLYALFQEVFSVADECKYLAGRILIENVKAFIGRIQNHDAWKAQSDFGYLRVQYQMMQELQTNNMICKQGEEIGMCFSSLKDDWENITVYVGSEESPTSVYTYCQEVSCKKFIDSFSGLANIFETVIRQFALPTKDGHFFT